MNCKDCIHNEVCQDFKRNICETCNWRHTEFKMNRDGLCDYFKDKSKYIELPCKVGDVVYVMEYEDDKIVDYSGYICIMANKYFAFLSPSLNDEENPIEICNIYFQRYIEDGFDPTSGIIVPLAELYTKDEAEARLKELRKNDL